MIFPGCIPSSEDLLRDNQNLSYAALSTGGAINGTVTFPSNTNSSLALKLDTVSGSITSFDGFSALLYGNNFLIQVKSLASAGGFLFTGTPLQKDLKIAIRKGRLELLAIIETPPFTGETIGVEVNTLTTAQALLFIRAQSLGETLTLASIGKEVHQESVDRVESAIIDVIASSTDSFSDPLATILDHSQVEGAVIQSLEEILLLENSSTTSTTSTTTTTTTTSTTTTTGVTSRPEVSLLLPADIQKGDIQVGLTIKDEDSSTVTIGVSYSLDGGSYRNATTNGLLEQMPANSGGHVSTFTWKTLSDFPDVNSALLRLKVVANDGVGSSTEEISNPIVIHNNFSRLLISDSSGSVRQVNSFFGVNDFISSSELASPTGVIEDLKDGYVILDNSPSAPVIYTSDTFGQKIARVTDLPANSGQETLALIPDSNGISLFISDSVTSNSYVLSDIISSYASTTINFGFLDDILFLTDDTGYAIRDSSLYYFSGNFATLTILIASTTGTFQSAEKLLLLDDDNLLVCDSMQNSILKVNLNTLATATLSNSTFLDSPMDLALNNSGNILVLNASDVVLINSSTGSGTQLISSGQFGNGQKFNQLVLE